MPATVSGILLNGDHASRPAANAAGLPVGSIYSCSTHSLIYVTDGGSWTTWADLAGTGGSVATDAIWDAAGDLAVGSGANTAAKLAAGADSTVLTISPSTHVPVWATPAAGGGGGLVLLEEHTASSQTTLDFTTCISSAYDTYRFELLDVLPATNGVFLVMRMGTGAGPTFDEGANYGFGMIRYNAAGSAGSGANTGALYISLTNELDTMSNDATYDGCSGFVEFFSPGSAKYKKTVSQIGYKATNWEACSGTGIYLVTTAVTGIRFRFSSGDIVSGTIRAYGIAKT